jgi:hypothetical protein
MHRFLRAVFACSTGALLGLTLIGIATFGWCPPAAAETKSEWYHSLRQPVTNGGCCDEADCALTPARQDGNGTWFVPPVDHIENGRWIPAPGPWIPVPERLILHDKRPFDGVSAVVCWVGGSIYCFVQGEAGG